MTVTNGDLIEARRQAEAVSQEDIAQAVTPEDATLWEKRMKALTMRNMGGTWAQIGRAFSISEDRAKRWVRDATKEVVKLPVDQMVDRQRAILLDITRRNYPIAMGDSDAARDAQGVIIRCLEHEAKLYGLYAPARVAVGIGEAEFGQNAAELLAAVGFGPLAELAGVSQAELESAMSATSKPHPEPDPPVEPESAVVDVDEVPDPEPWSNL